MHSRYKKASSKIARRNKTRRIFGSILKIGLPVVVLVGLIILSRAEFLQVKNFEVSGTEIIQPEDVKNTALNFASGARFFLIPKSNIFLLNKEKLASVLLVEFPRAATIKISKLFLSQSIELSVTERKSDFLWCSSQDLSTQAGECFSMTKDGLIFVKILPNKSADKIVFRGILEGNPLMKNFATPAKMQNYSNLIKTFKDAGFNVNSINIESSDRAIANINMGDIIFNPEEADLSLVAQNTILLINEIKSKNSSARFNYIDARFGNKLFYKLY